LQDVLERQLQRLHMVKLGVRLFSRRLRIAQFLVSACVALASMRRTSAFDLQGLRVCRCRVIIWGSVYRISTYIQSYANFLELVRGHRQAIGRRYVGA
jgi:hypothetical protein